MFTFMFFVIVALGAGLAIAFIPRITYAARFRCFALLHVIPTVLWCLATLFGNSFALDSLGDSLLLFCVVWVPFILAPSALTFVVAMTFNKEPEKVDPRDTRNS
jgi:hypothetical protein